MVIKILLTISLICNIWCVFGIRSLCRTINIVLEDLKLKQIR